MVGLFGLNLNVGTQAFSIEQENLMRLGWYLAPFGVALSVAGACHLVWRINRRTFFHCRHWPVLFVALPLEYAQQSAPDLRHAAARASAVAVCDDRGGGCAGLVVDPAQAAGDGIGGCDWGGLVGRSASGRRVASFHSAIIGV